MTSWHGKKSDHYKGEDHLLKTSSLLEQYVEFIPSVGYDYHKNPWYGYIDQDMSYQTKSEVKTELSEIIALLDNMIPIIGEISKKYNVSCTSIEDANIWKSFLSLAASSDFITPALLNKEHFESANSLLNELSSRSQDIISVREALNEVFDSDLYKLDGAVYYKKLTKQFSGTFSRLFNAEYKQIIGSLRLCRKDGRKTSYNEAVKFTEQLSYYQQKCNEYNEMEMPVKGFFGPAYNGVDTDWKNVTGQMSFLQMLFTQNIVFGGLAELNDLSTEKEAFDSYSKKLAGVISPHDEESISRLERHFDKNILAVRTTSGYDLYAHLKGCLDNMDRLDNWCQFRALLSQLDDLKALSFINTAIEQNLEPKHVVGAFKKKFYYQWIDVFLSEIPALSSFNRISQEKAIHTFSEKDKEQFVINKAKIRAVLSSMRPTVDIVAPGSALATLLREGDKKRRQKSIRNLLIETGELVQRIKPCFLMSPLSVSTFLAPGSVEFDVVIFDEASQIFPQDAVGAIYRAKQLIVVGDSKQMPPSNFFSASAASDETDEEVGDITDFESILDLCSTTLRQLRLRWHYRSRFEQLISFSNKNYYDNDLVTFPSSKTDTKGIGVDYYHADGVFDRKSHTNRKEAEYVVDLIYKNIERFPNRSLGIVAFSVAQQDMIDKLLSKRRQSTPEKEWFFKNDAQEPFL